MENYFNNLLVKNKFWFYFLLKRQFGWGGNLPKSTGGEYKICFMYLQKKMNDQNKFD